VTAPFQFCGTTGGSGVSSKVAAVTVATAAGDALVIAVGIGGTSPPSVSGVTDSAGNTYSLAESVTAASPFLYVYAATGGTVALTTLSTVTVTFSGNTTGGFGITGTDCPGVAAVDVAQAASGSSGAPSVTGTPSQSGETALAAFAWGNTGAAGTISSPFTGCGQEHPSGGTYVTCAYDTSPASGSPLTAAASITSTAWRAILITFETAPPAGLWYMTNVAYIAGMDSGNTSDTHALFSHAASFGISNSASTPGIPAGYACTPLLRYTSYAQLQADITASAISGSYTWLMYDTEDWSQTPQGEIDNPWTYMGDFVTLAHAHGYKAILAPALDLGNDATSVSPKMPGETDPAWYTRTNIAGTAAATGAEVIHIQAQSLTTTGSYASFVASCVSQVIAGETSGLQQVSVGISTSYGTPAQMLAAVQSATGASGVWRWPSAVAVPWSSTSGRRRSRSPPPSAACPRRCSPPSSHWTAAPRSAAGPARRHPAAGCS
jgi:hypothetical protein